MKEDACPSSCHVQGEMLMNVVFRVDASSEIGTGHLMRCLTLADTLAGHGTAVHFLCRRLPGDLIDWVRETRGYEVTIVEPAFDVSPDAAVFQALGRIDWLVIDHYGLDVCFETTCRADADKILVIDDLADRPHDCDILLDQNAYPDAKTRYADLLPATCARLLGPKYALLRPEFLQARLNPSENGPENKPQKRVLVSFGGSDPANMTLRALQAINSLSEEKPEAEVIAGASNPHYAEIEAFVRTRPWITLSKSVNDMAARMSRATCCLGAGGTTALERMALGLPSVAVSIADNQLEVSQALDGLGAHWYLGPAESVTEVRLQQALQTLLLDADLRQAFACKGKALVDGFGAQRVANRLLGGDLLIRPVLPEESVALYRWRNDEQVRQFSHDSREIAWDDHCRWFAAVLQNPARHLLIGEMDGDPVGVLRYDVEGMQALVSVYLVPGLGGQGYGTRLLQAGSGWLARHCPGVRRILAEILSDNPASLRAFEKAGYVPAAAENKMDQMKQYEYILERSA